MLYIRNLIHFKRDICNSFLKWIDTSSANKIGISCRTARCSLIFNEYFWISLAKNSLKFVEKAHYNNVTYCITSLKISLLCYIRAKWDRACWKSNLKYYVTTCHILKWKMHSIEIQSDSTDVIYFIRSSIGKLDLILEFQRACMRGF